MTDKPDIVQRLRAAALDPMWADHAEVRKEVLLEAAERITEQRFWLERPNARIAAAEALVASYRAEVTALREQFGVNGEASQ